MVRDLVRKILERAGYRVMLACDGEDALNRVTRHRGPIQLVISDIIMPRMGGRELVERLRDIRPETKALYMSGYAASVIVKQGLADPLIPLLEKPFTAQGVIKRVKKVLGKPSG